jgi:hypothetical protein
MILNEDTVNMHHRINYLHNLMVYAKEEGHILDLVYEKFRYAAQFPLSDCLMRCSFQQKFKEVKESKNDELRAYAALVWNEIQAEGFTCLGCKHILSMDYNLRTERYCYLCDPAITLEECLSDDPIERFKHLTV